MTEPKPTEEINTRAKLVKESAIAHLQRLKIKYDSIDEPEYKADCEIALKNGGATKANVWIVAYTYTVFQDEIAFIYLDDHSFKLIYILTNHGYIV